MKVYSIKNEKIGFFNRPIYCESAPEALTYLQNVLTADADRVMYGLRDDLALYELGEVDFVKGTLHGYKKPVRICGLSDIFASVPAESIPRTEEELRREIHDLRELISPMLKEYNEFKKEVSACAECCVE